MLSLWFIFTLSQLFGILNEKIFPIVVVKVYKGYITGGVIIVREMEEMKKADVTVMLKDIGHYEDFVQPYEVANSVLNIWLFSLKKDFGRVYKREPIHSIQNRIKSLSSIFEKLERKHQKVGLESAMDYLTDIAGTRVLCYYPQDVYKVADMLKKQSGAIVIKEKDYIKNPKENGYRSLHLILGIQVLHEGNKQYFPVEVQIRTLAMDFWASMEHQLCYKLNRIDKKELSKELKEYSITLENMEVRMGEFNTDYIKEYSEV